MSDLKALLLSPPVKQTLQGFLDGLDEETHTLLMQRLADPSVSAVWLSEVLGQVGFQVSESTVRVYRRRLVL